MYFKEELLEDLFIDKLCYRNIEDLIGINKE